jgi:hypothetical protein
MKRTPTIAQRLINLTEQEVRDAVLQAHCWTQVAIELGFNSNSGSQIRIVLDTIKAKYILDTSHFDPMKKVRKRQWIIKVCPACGDEFQAQRGGTRNEKTTCSYGCANTYFRTGSSNGAYGSRSGRHGVPKHIEVCWSNHEKRCIICDERLIVEAHHYNGNHDDNRPENFVPLCSTHHKYWHSRYRYLIQTQCDAYVVTFIEKQQVV